VTSVKDKMGLSHTKEIENAIAEVNDVLKTYRTLMKQTEEASKYLQKWGVASEHAELIAAFGLSATQSDVHKGALVALCDVIQNDYLKVLVEIQKMNEALGKQQAHLESQSNNKKVQASDLEALRNTVNAEYQRVQKETEVKYKAAALLLARAFVKYHENQLESQRAVVRGLEAAAAAAAPVVQQQPQQAHQQPQVHHTPAAVAPVASAPAASAPPATDDDDDVLPPGPIGAINPSTAPQADDEQPPGPIGAVGSASDEPPPPYTA
jgi:hypothetical protein